MRPIPVEGPRAPAGLNGLGIVPQLVVRAGEGGKPAVQARISGAEPDPGFGQLDRLCPPPDVNVHLSEHNMGGGKARV